MQTPGPHYFVGVGVAAALVVVDALRLVRARSSTTTRNLRSIGMYFDIARGACVEVRPKRSEQALGLFLWLGVIPFGSWITVAAFAAAMLLRRLRRPAAFGAARAVHERISAAPLTRDAVRAALGEIATLASYRDPVIGPIRGERWHGETTLGRTTFELVKATARIRVRATFVAGDRRTQSFPYLATFAYVCRDEHVELKLVERKYERLELLGAFDVRDGEVLARDVLARRGWTMAVREALVADLRRQAEAHAPSDPLLRHFVMVRCWAGTTPALMATLRRHRSALEAAPVASDAAAKAAHEAYRRMLADDLAALERNAAFDAPDGGDHDPRPRHHAA
jgi:hypothetical protein